MNDTVHAEANFIAVNALGYGLTDCNTMTLKSVERHLKYNGACTDTLVITYTIEDACHNTKQVYQLQRIHDSLAPSYTKNMLYAEAVACVTDTVHAETNIDAVKALYGLADCNAMSLTSVTRELKHNGACTDTLEITYKIEDPCGNFTKVYQRQRIHDSLAPVALYKDTIYA